MNEIWTRRRFIQRATGTAAGLALSSCAINVNRAPQKLSEAALATEPLVKPESLEKPNLTVGYVPVNDCAPFAVAW
jgi:nitrate/nitrite transport system substrate-binding protein